MVVALAGDSTITRLLPLALAVLLLRRAEVLLVFAVVVLVALAFAAGFFLVAVFVVAIHLRYPARQQLGHTSTGNSLRSSQSSYSSDVT